MASTSIPIQLSPSFFSDRSGPRNGSANLLHSLYYPSSAPSTSGGILRSVNNGSSTTADLELPNAKYRGEVKATEQSDCVLLYDEVTKVRCVPNSPVHPS